MNIFEIAQTIKELIVSGRDFIVSIPWPKVIFTLKSISLIVSILFFAGIIFLIFVLNVFKKLKRNLEILTTPQQVPRKKLLKKWNQIEARLKSSHETDSKLAVIEADKLLDDVLKRCGYFGKDMGSRLKKINSGQIASINDVWSAHKVRNSIVHNIDYKLTELEAERAIRAFKKALEELEAI